MELLSWKDLALTPIYVGILLVITNIMSSKIPVSVRRYFKLAILFRIFATIFFALVHGFKYGGDTQIYFVNGSSYIIDAAFESPLLALNIIFNPTDLMPEAYKYTSKMIWGLTDPEGFIIRISALLGFFTFHTYTLNALIISMFSFSGLWRCFIIFRNEYPLITKQLAFAFLFTPSVIFWSSGILKDPITLGALCWLFASFYHGLIEKKNIIKAIIIGTIMIWLIANIKVYILLSFLPPALLWVFNENSNRIKNKVVRIISKPIFFILGGIMAIISLSKITEGDAQYSLEKIGETSKITHNYLSTSQTSGSLYNIPEFDGSLESFFNSAPQAINVALFRPYIWEVKNPFMLLSALESIIFLIITINVLFIVGFFRFFYKSVSVPLVFFSLMFSLIFAFGVGSTSGNFGTLVRYKIPLMPFYLSSLFILLFLYKKKGSIKLNRNISNYHLKNHKLIVK